MDNVKASIESLKKAALKKNVDQTVRVEIDQVSSFFALLDISSPSIETTAKLIHIFRKRLSALYNSVLHHALQLAANTFILLSEKLSIASRTRDNDALGAWGEIQRSIISGAMDFLESTSKPEAKSTMGAAFLKPICDFYLPPKGLAADNISTSLKCSVYGLLEELSTSDFIVQKLRNSQYLGGKRLGMTLLQTNDYLTFETLLNLFIRLLPLKTGPSGSTASIQYIRDVFVTASPAHIEVGREIEHVLMTISSNEWEATVMKITDIVARSRAEFPQPFNVDEIRIGNRCFPQTGPFDRLFVDVSSFLVNVDEPESGAYDVLRVFFTGISGIKLKRESGAAKFPVVIELHKSAILGDTPLSRDEGDSIAPLTFDLGASDYGRFIEALRARKIDHLIAPPRSTGQKVSLSSAPLVFGNFLSDNHGDMGAKAKDICNKRPSGNDVGAGVPNLPPTISLLESSPEINPGQVSPGSAAMCEVAEVIDSHIGQAKLRPSSFTIVVPETPQNSRDEGSYPPWTSGNVRVSQLSAAQACAASTQDVPSAPVLARDISGAASQPGKKMLSRTHSQKQRDAIFGASSDELSDISDDERTSMIPLGTAQSARHKSNSRRVGSTMQKAIPTAGFGNKVLDSGEKKMAAPRKKGAKKKAHSISVADDGDDIPLMHQKEKTAPANAAHVAEIPSGFTHVDSRPAPSKRKNPPRSARAAARSRRNPATVKPTHVEPATEAQPQTSAQANTSETSSSETVRPLAVSHAPSVELLSSGPETPLPPVSSLKSNDKPPHREDSITAPQRPASPETPSRSTLRHQPPAPTTRVLPNKRKRDEADRTEDSPPHETSRVDAQQPPIKRVRAEEVLKPTPRPKKRAGASSPRRNKARRNGKNASKPLRSPSKPVASALPPSDLHRLGAPVLRNLPHCKDKLPAEAGSATGKMKSVAGENLTSSLRRKEEKIEDLEDSNTSTARSWDPELGQDEAASSRLHFGGETQTFASDPAHVPNIMAPKNSTKHQDPTSPALEEGPPNITWHNTGPLQHKSLGLKELEKARTKPESHVKAPYSDTTAVKETTSDPSTDETPSLELLIEEDATLIEIEDLVPSTKIDSSDQVVLCSRKSPKVTRSGIGVKIRKRSSCHSTPIRRENAVSSKIPIRTINVQRDHKLLKSQEAIPNKNFARRATANSAKEIPKRKEYIQVVANVDQDSFQDRIMVEIGTHHHLDLLKSLSKHLLSEINAVVVRNIGRKVDGALKKVRIARDTIIIQGCADLEEMRFKRIEHYNALVDLENEYAMHRRQLINSFENCHKISQEGIAKLNQILQDHDRKSLSKKFPPSLL